MEHLFSKMATGNLQPNQMVIVERGGEEEGGCDFPPKEMLYSIQTGGGMQVHNISPVEQAIIQAKSKMANRKRKRSASKHHSAAKRRKRRKGKKKARGKKRKTNGKKAKAKRRLKKAIQDVFTR